MNPAATYLQRIENKLRQLLKQFHDLQKENRQLRDELGKSQQLASRHLENIEELKQQVTVLKMSSHDMNPADKKEMEKRINGYLKEIDRCIAMLGE